jgi:hypothetical protein
MGLGVNSLAQNRLIIAIIGTFRRKEQMADGRLSGYLPYEKCASRLCYGDSLPWGSA